MRVTMLDGFGNVADESTDDLIADVDEKADFVDSSVTYKPGTANRGVLKGELSTSPDAGVVSFGGFSYDKKRSTAVGGNLTLTVTVGSLSIDAPAFEVQGLLFTFTSVPTEVTVGQSFVAKARLENENGNEATAAQKTSTNGQTTTLKTLREGAIIETPTGGPFNLNQ
eukprot:gene21518-8250_t